jgi:dihydrodipicolinate synthase/N-acetylneuraminate lyase
MASYAPKKGLSIPVITVVDDTGRVIADEQRQVFRHVIQHGYGADVIFGVGTTGEWNRLANAERQRVMELEVDEVRRVNAELQAQGRAPVEAWVGLNGRTRAEILANLDAAIQLGANAAVIAPLAIEDLDEGEIVRFFHRELASLIEAAPRTPPVFLYDNADISAAGHAPHIRTRIVKHLSRLPWIAGIKVSAPRRVLGNYTKAALHFKQPGEFGIYIGNAMLMFELYRPTPGWLGRLREGWQTYLLHDAPPIGVVSGPANAMPREWQKAWRACWAGDEELTDLYRDLCRRFEAICGFEENGQRVKKTIACLKYALELDGVISSSAVARGTKALSAAQQESFAGHYRALRESVRRAVEPLWQTALAESRLKSTH